MVEVVEVICSFCGKPIEENEERIVIDWENEHYVLHVACYPAWAAKQRGEEPKKPEEEPEEPKEPEEPEEPEEQAVPNVSSVAGVPWGMKVIAENQDEDK